MSEKLTVWHTLKASEVYHIAHLENEALDRSEAVVNAASDKSEAEQARAKRISDFILNNHVSRASE
jgi:hypothetical protein